MRILRYLTGYVFIISGLMKFLSDFNAAFTSMGIPSAELIVLIVAVTEIVCGGMIVLDYYVKQATIPLLVIIIAALLLNKVPELHQGLFVFLFKARLDIVMLFILLLLGRKY